MESASSSSRRNGTLDEFVNLVVQYALAYDKQKQVVLDARPSILQARGLKPKAGVIKKRPSLFQVSPAVKARKQSVDSSSSLPKSKVPRSSSKSDSLNRIQALRKGSPLK
jgi:hypothetical protein